MAVLQAIPNEDCLRRNESEKEEEEGFFAAKMV